MRLPQGAAAQAKVTESRGPVASASSSGSDSVETQTSLVGDWSQDAAGAEGTDLPAGAAHGPVPGPPQMREGGGRWG